MSKEKILIVDDEKSIREFLEIMLKKEGYKVGSAVNAEEALKLFHNSNYELVISDIKMSGMDGVELLKKIKEINPETIVLMITAYASVDTAIDAMKAGAYDYITKPFNVDEVKHIIQNALDRRRLETENILLKKELKSRYSFANLVGTSPKMLEIYGLIKRVANTRTNILISGESGTGKELVARAIHYESERKEKPFVPINCGAIPENLLESELFGHQKGAFTGAVANKSGLFEVANDGTIFLDEITELPKELQVKLLRVIQERNFRRVGGIEDILVDVRIIAASNKEIDKEVKEGRFREDLFYRLNVIPIQMPPLRERQEDIRFLAEHFFEKHKQELGKDIKGISHEAMDYLESYSYPGNIRELENIIERAVALENTSIILPESLPEYIRTQKVGWALPTVGGQEIQRPEIEMPEGGINLEKHIEDYEKAIILDALKKSGGVKKKAAELLGMSFRSMRYKIDKYGIE
ncbi:MAG: Fis family transcriptional regulator [Deltaproteobacteria bacterium GWC2_42_51]|nr:MAG: Fis family transcriptional regulator [Deltaproteobacteria bacterium GWB2_42_7]OGP34018.1 MAG: Fis family transcriptional regulator [Deltaproteobacteria bacterium GWC2_42_51]OGP37865.1 MAG: Fis family transcriptional regulator [Deltaproteobacteria bacterium GWD2_42_10]OGP48015.1 MAG: Fis family transcriptional regulator [Deltaproteobacteria bacterium GWF2_42_12]OGQ29764.1 MAG: Fis family transcriptional regulator [Deltaproteobacteria bacterium RIFCSPHIGHO2_02_FULL_42_44]OGQ38714.1 MAG: 